TRDYPSIGHNLSRSSAPVRKMVTSGPLYKLAFGHYAVVVDRVTHPRALLLTACLLAAAVDSASQGRPTTPPYEDALFAAIARARGWPDLRTGSFPADYREIRIREHL